MTSIRCDLIDVYVFRRRAGSAEFLQLRRTHPPLAGSWQPVMGHTEPGEPAAACAVRELHEETGLKPGQAGPPLLGLWALEEVHPYFVAALDAVMLSPRFAAEVSEGWEPVLNGEHDAARWVAQGEVEQAFMWPGQRGACAEVVREIIAGTAVAELLRIGPGTAR